MVTTKALAYATSYLNEGFNGILAWKVYKHRKITSYKINHGPYSMMIKLAQCNSTVIISLNYIPRYVFVLIPGSRINGNLFM